MACGHQPCVITMKTKTYRVSREEKQHIIDRIAHEMELRNEIVFAYVYGSLAEDADLPVHDIDVGVHVSGIGKEAAAWYAQELAQALCKKAGMPVDVRVVNFAPVPFLYHVIRGVPVFSRDEDVRTRIVEQTIRQYLDMKPLIRRGIQEAFAA